ncbi:MAG: hypothetical protein FJW37_00125 [Acidobacteria bacterium]|nr:hypothetical protein [Acidobacteriota bacterium]
MNGLSDTFALRVDPPPPVELKDLTCTPAIFQGPGTSGCTVLLTGTAPAGGIAASLAFSTTGVSPTMPTALTIPAGASSGNFAVQAGGVTAVTTITLSATVNGLSDTFALRVDPPPPPTSGGSGVTAFPAAVVVLTGNLKSGGAAELRANDDKYFGVASKAKTAAWYGSFPGVAKALKNLKVTYIGKNSTTCMEKVSIWNWRTGAWIDLDWRPIGETEVLRANLAAAGTPGDYVSGSSATGEVRIRVQSVNGKREYLSSGEMMSITYEQ